MRRRSIAAKEKHKCRRKKGQPHDNPVSLAPLDFKDLLIGLLAVKPKPKDRQEPEKEQPGD